MASRTQELVEHLTARIREGVIRPGEKLPTEARLVADHGVSRTVVREAISRLAAAGLVETRHGKGSFVLAQPSTSSFPTVEGGERTLDDIVDLVEFRIAVETEAAALAAVRRSPAQLSALERALDEFASCADNPGAAVRADHRFHVRVALATGNRYFSDLLTSFGPSLIVMHRDRLPSGEAGFAHVVAEHAEVYDAVARSDPDHARAAMRLHLTRSRARLLAAQRQTSEPVPGPSSVASWGRCGGSQGGGGRRAGGASTEDNGTEPRAAGS